MKKTVAMVLGVVFCSFIFASLSFAEGFDFEEFQKYLKTLTKADMKYKSVIIDKFSISDSDKVDREHEPEQMLKMAEVTLVDILTKSNLFDSVLIRANQPNPDSAIIVKAELTDLRVVSSTKRLFLGALAGNSGMEIKGALVKAAGSKVVNEFNVRDEANAFSGAWTMGGSDRNIAVNVAEQMAAVVVKNSLVERK